MCDESQRDDEFDKEKIVLNFMRALHKFDYDVSWQFDDTIEVYLGESEVKLTITFSDSGSEFCWTTTSQEHEGIPFGDERARRFCEAWSARSGARAVLSADEGFPFTARGRFTRPPSLDEIEELAMWYIMQEEHVHWAVGAIVLGTNLTLEELVNHEDGQGIPPEVWVPMTSSPAAVTLIAAPSPSPDVDTTPHVLEADGDSRE